MTRILVSLFLAFTMLGPKASASRHLPCDAWHWKHVANAPQMQITYYLATGNRTSTGTWPWWGEVAVDPKAPIPMGSWICIEGLPIRFHAEDTGSLVGPYHIDVFCPSDALGRLVQGCPATGYRKVYWFKDQDGPGW